MVLCIDTTTLFSGITLVGDQTFWQPLEAHHASEKILETIDQLIQKAGIKLSDLTAVMVIKGPGSFTGLRVGIAVANQFAHQLSIPIIGVRTDEWWRHRMDESDFLYLQTMNKSEVYISEFRFQNSDLNQKSEIRNQKLNYIIPIADLPSEKRMWIGELSNDHREKLPSDFTEITDLRSPEETWAKIIENTLIDSQKKYDLVEPFYGKEPTITKSKRRLSV